MTDSATETSSKKQIKINIGQSQHFNYCIYSDKTQKPPESAGDKELNGHISSVFTEEFARQLRENVERVNAGKKEAEPTPDDGQRLVKPEEFEYGKTKQPKREPSRNLRTENAGNVRIDTHANDNFKANEVEKLRNSVNNLNCVEKQQDLSNKYIEMSGGQVYSKATGNLVYVSAFRRNRFGGQKLFKISLLIFILLIIPASLSILALLKSNGVEITKSIIMRFSIVIILYWIIVALIYQVRKAILEK